MEYEILTGILRRFVIYLEDLPANLRLLAHSLLFFLLVIDIAITIYNHIDDENFSYIKWTKSKILKVGFIIFMINKYEWVLNGVKSFFFDVAGKAIRTNLFSNNEFFENPSELYSKGADLAAYIYDDGVSWYSPSSWGYIILSILIIIGFLMLAVQLIICWIEYYFLTGFSIVFLPFGVLDVGLDYYKSVFKTILSCSIKLAVMNFWLRLSTAILNDLFKLTNKNIKLELVILIFGTLYVIVAIMQFLPSMTSGLLTGTPAVNASAAVAAAKASALGTVTGAAHIYRGAKETVKGAVKGAKIGANSIGGSLGAPGSVGNIVGSTFGGAVGAIIGGSYAGARYGVFKEKAKDKKNNGSSNGGGNTPQSGSGSGGNSGGTPNQQNTNSNSSSNGGGNTPQSGNSSGGNSGGTPNQKTTNSNGSGNNGQSGTSSNVQSSTGNINSTTQGQVNTSNSTQVSSNSSVNSGGTQIVTTSNDTDFQTSGSTTNTADSTSTTHSNDTNQSTGSSSSSNTENNVDNFNNDTSSTANNTDTTSNTSSNTGDGSEKRGIRVNGGEAGKIPDWMQGDYYK